MSNESKSLRLCSQRDSFDASSYDVGSSAGKIVGDTITVITVISRAYNYISGIHQCLV